MATAKQQEEKRVQTLRKMVALPHNRHCFDCGQRGPTYVNMTIGAYVCTACSGILRGINPPHRVKSISMASFTQDEIELLQQRGNAYNNEVWLGLHDTKEPPNIDNKDEIKLRDYMSKKYEKKRWYLEPTSDLAEKAKKRNNETAARPQPASTRRGVSIRPNVPGSLPRIEGFAESNPVSVPSTQQPSLMTQQSVTQAQPAQQKNTASSDLLADVFASSAPAPSATHANIFGAPVVSSQATAPFGQPAPQANAFEQPNFANFGGAPVAPTQPLGSTNPPLQPNSQTSTATPDDPTIADPIGDANGASFGVPFGSSFGEPLGASFGESLGDSLGASYGDPLGNPAGAPIVDLVSDKVADVTLDTASSASPWSLSGAGTTASAASAAPLGGDRYASLSGLFADGDVAISEPAAAPSAPSASVNWNTVNWGGSTNSAAPSQPEMSSGLNWGGASQSAPTSSNLFSQPAVSNTAMMGVPNQPASQWGVQQSTGVNPFLVASSQPMQTHTGFNGFSQPTGQAQTQLSSGFPYQQPQAAQQPFGHQGGFGAAFPSSQASPFPATNGGMATFSAAQNGQSWGAPSSQSANQMSGQMQWGGSMQPQSQTSHWGAPQAAKPAVSVNPFLMQSQMVPIQQTATNPFL